VREGFAMKRWWSCVIGLAVMAMIAGGCTGDEPTTTTNGGQEPVELELWIFEGEDEFLPTLKREFESEHPNITVKITHIPEENYVTKIDTALAAGSPPDIGYMYEPRWMKAGRVVPLDDVISSHQIDVSNYNQSAFSYCTPEEETYCLGSYSGSIMLFYNKELFDDAGLPYPSATEPLTVDEYAALAAELTEPAEDRSKYVWGGYADVTTWWLDWRNLFNEDATQVVGYLNDPPTVHLYDVLARMVREGHSPSESDFEFFGDTDILATGQLAMTITDNVVAIPTLERAGIDWGAAPVPVEQEGDLPWVSSWSDFWGVFSGSEHTEAAKEFVAFVGTEGNRLRAETGQQPLDVSVAEETDWAGDSEGRAEAIEVSKLARPVLFLPGNIFSIDGPLWDAFGLIVEGQRTAQQALDEAAPDMQQNLDRAWETWEQI
jgi:multiple sugar transport system substrate-binding protein